MGLLLWALRRKRLLQGRHLRSPPRFATVAPLLRARPSPGHAPLCCWSAASKHNEGRRIGSLANQRGLRQACCACHVWHRAVWLAKAAEEELFCGLMGMDLLELS